MTPELVSPEFAQMLVLGVALAFCVFGAVLGFRARGAIGLLGALVGPLVFALWLGHVALQERLGTDSLALLIGETALFVALGALLGRIWPRRAQTDSTNSRTK